VHQVERYANNRIEADHNLLKHRLRPMRGLRIDRTTQVIITGLAFMQNLRRGHPAYLRHAHRLSRNGLPSNRNARAAAATTNGRSNSRTSRSRWRSPASPPATDRVPIPV
jgi:hypothetical protein